MKAEYSLDTQCLRVHPIHFPGELAELDVAVEIAPYLQSTESGSFLPVCDGEPLHFAPVPVESICDFAVMHLTHRQTGIDRRFAVQLELNLPDAVRDARDRQLQTKLLEGADPSDLLWRLLAGATPHRPGISSGGMGQGGGGVFTRSILAELTIERVIEACTADPSRIEEVSLTLRSLPAVGDEGFRAFWSAFVQASQMVRKEAANG